MEITVYGPLRSVTGGKHAEIDFDGGNAATAIEAFVDAYPRADRHLFGDDGALIPSVRLLADGEAVDPGDEIPPDATLSIHPAMRGG